MIREFGERLTHHLELMQHEVCQVSIVRLRKSKRLIIGLGRAIDGPRNGKKFGQFVAVSEHAPVVQGSSYSTISITEWMFVAYPKMDDDRSDHRMDEGVASIDSSVFSKPEQPRYSFAKALGWRRGVPDGSLDVLNDDRVRCAPESSFRIWDIERILSEDAVQLQNIVHDEGTILIP